MNISLSKFCKDNDLPKSSVYRRCQELKIPTADGLASGDADRLLIEFDCIPQAEEPAAVATATVEIGNHQMVLAAPQFPQTYSLASLRSSEAISIDDPLAVAQQFLEAADQIADAMESDLLNRKAKLNQTRQAKDAIASKAMALKLQQQRYQEKAYQLDSEQSDQTYSLQDALAQLQTLGKPQDS